MSAYYTHAGVIRVEDMGNQTGAGFPGLQGRRANFSRPPLPLPPKEQRVRVGERPASGGHGKLPKKPKLEAKQLA